MKHTIHVDVDSTKIILELNDTFSPKTVNEFVEKLPFSVNLNVWGDEIYSSKSPINQPEENAKSSAELNDVAYWPTGNAICLFYGPTPISEPGAITPASPVNIIGKVISPDKSILNVADGMKATFRKS